MHNFFMSEALIEAKKAFDKGEVPVGAVVVSEGKIIGRGHNNRESLNLATSHAEIEAINDASRHLGSWRLSDCSIYVTLEPCPMCSGAIINARISNLIYGALDQKAGCAYSKINLFECGFNHKPNIKHGVLETECGNILKEFFTNVRQN